MFKSHKLLAGQRSTIFMSIEVAMAQVPEASVDDKKTNCLSVDDVGFFEGPEKLLEMWFHLFPQGTTNHGVSSVDSNSSGLRIIPRYAYLELV